MSAPSTAAELEARRRAAATGEISVAERGEPLGDGLLAQQIKIGSRASLGWSPRRPRKEPGSRRRPRFADLKKVESAVSIGSSDRPCRANPALERFGRKVDEDDLVGGVEHVVGERLPHTHTHGLQRRHRSGSPGAGRSRSRSRRRRDRGSRRCPRTAWCFASPLAFVCASSSTSASSGVGGSPRRRPSPPARSAPG